MQKKNVKTHNWRQVQLIKLAAQWNEKLKEEQIDMFIENIATNKEKG